MQPNRAVAERRLVNPAKTGILYYQVVPWLPAFSFIRTVMVMDIAGLIDSGAKRHHYSTFDVGRSMFDVHLFSVRCSSFQSSFFSLLSTFLGSFEILQI